MVPGGRIYTSQPWFNFLGTTLVDGWCCKLYGLTLICIEALQNQWCFRGFFIFCHHLHLEPRVITASYLPHLILVSGHCLFPLSIKGIYLAYQLVPWCSFVRPPIMNFREIHKKGHFAESAQACFRMLDFLVHTNVTLDPVIEINSVRCVSMCP